jgi:hypothetical protein
MSKYWRLRGFTFDKFGIILLFILYSSDTIDDLFQTKIIPAQKLLLEQDIAAKT